MSAFYLFNDDREPMAGPYPDFEAAEFAYQVAVNSGDFGPSDGFYVAAGSDDLLEVS